MNQTLETERLLLRPFALSDIAVFYELGTSRSIIRHVGNKPFESVTAAEVALIEGPLRDYEVYGYGRFACVFKETGRVIGFSGLKFLKELDDTELGYRFLPEYWGRGLATEAGRASIGFAQSELRLRRLIGVVHPENEASKVVLGKLGFSLQGHTAFSVLGDMSAELYVRQI